MIVVKPKKTIIETQIDVNFEAPKEGEEKKESSVKGALHFKPGVIKTITKDEYEFIQKKYPDFAKNLQVLFEKEDKAKTLKEKRIEDRKKLKEEVEKRTAKIKKKADTIEEEKK